MNMRVLVVTEQGKEETQARNKSIVIVREAKRKSIA